MLIIGAYILFLLTVLSIIIQGWLVLRYAWRMERLTNAESKREFQPKVTIVLCLRGNDPSLDACLQALLAQQYDDYCVMCVFDSENDPAHAVVAEYSTDSRLVTRIAPPRGQSCSLKCNSLVTVFDSIEDKIAVLVDADTAPDRHWLADLVAPLQDENVVASSANRWFLPTDHRTGSYVRYLWNLAAAPQMDAYQITWGGSLALKTRFVRESGLLEAWGKSLFEDVSVTGFATRQNQQVKMLPQLLVPNQESVSVRGMTGWMRRQLLDIRLYHRCFGLVVVHSLSVIGMLLFAFILLAVCIASDDAWKPALVVLMSLLNFAVLYLCSWIVLDKKACDALKSRGHQLPAKRWGSPRIVWMIVITQWVYAVSTWKALRTRRVSWRGIDYEIQGPYSIAMLEYQEMSGGDKKSTESL